MTKAPSISKHQSKRSPSAEIRAQLSHPVIDTDLHTVEFSPLFEDYIDKVGGAKSVDEYRAAVARGYANGSQWYKLSWEERRLHNQQRPPWWGRASENTRDLATVSLPRLLHERLAEQGTDFAILYPNITTFAVVIPRADLRRVVVRAVNLYNADVFRPYADRLAPVAAVPLHTPEEGIEELQFAVKELGYKVALVPGSLRRPIAALAGKYPAKEHPEIARHLTWLDTFGIDSAYDYDPFWAKAVELKIPLTTHSGGMGWTSRNSWSNYMYNHIGHFASASEAFAKSLFLGGVTYRFPKLRVGLLEGGAAYGSNLYADLVGHWEKRSGEAVQKYNPDKLKVEYLHQLYREYADRATLDRLGSVEDLAKVAFGVDSDRNARDQDFNKLDEFAAAHIEKIEDIRDRFVPNFYFGAEADDPTVAHAFNSKVHPLGVELHAFWASDSGHWDVPDLTQVLSDTYRLVEQGALTEQNFRDLTFSNPYEFYAGTNPAFFKGTAIERELQKAKAAAE
jgi:predicted TIM-barrel fold metal-dependent hydrolase